MITGDAFVDGGAGGAGVVYSDAKGTTAPKNGTAKGKARITGNPASSAIPDFDANVDSIFGVEEQDLRAMADVAVTSEADFPSPIPTNSIVYSDVVSMTLDSGNPLSGFGVVYHTGNLTLEPGNSSNFSGLLYVNGDLVVNSPADLKGTVIVTGSAKIDGKGDFSTITYDPDALSALQDKFAQYRFSTPIRRRK